MITKRTKTITIETRRRIVIRQTSRQPVRCKFCAEQVERLTPAQAATSINIDLCEIQRRIKDGLFHFTADNNNLLICFGSLTDPLRQKIIE